MSISSLVQISPLVRQALACKRPVVALESTILTHGGFTKKMALQVEEAVRGNDQVEPATIGILDGKIKVGMNESELERLTLAEEGKVKISRRDLVRLDDISCGGTTVSGTLAIMKMVGLDILATGGIGGVHRDRLGHDSMDVSADLHELARANVMVVSAGIKSILDIPKTLEKLESLGVTVLVYDPSDPRLPSFYSPSIVKAPLHVKSMDVLAKMVRNTRNLGLGSGMLVTVHPPKEFTQGGAGQLIESAVQRALKEMEQASVSGKDITPWLLKRVDELSQGKALESNYALMLNNARTASEMAIAAAGLDGQHTPSMGRAPASESTVAVIGAAVLDIVAAPVGPSLAGSTSPGIVKFLPGGVGRNMAEACGRSGARTSFISILGQDPAGLLLTKSLEEAHVSTAHLQKVQGTSPTCSMFLNKGVMDRGYIDTDIIGNMDPAQVSASLRQLAPKIIGLDANVPDAVMTATVEFALQHQVPANVDAKSIKDTALNARQKLCEAANAYA